MVTLSGYTLPVSVVIASAALWYGYVVVATCLLLYFARTTWHRWFTLRITIDSVVYKDDAASVRQRIAVPPMTGKVAVDTKRTSGFVTPRGDNEAQEPVDTGQSLDVMESPSAQCNFIEFAPFAPSFPYGEPVTNPENETPYWLTCDASAFLVRDIRYKQMKEKVPSDFALYDCVGMDMIRDKRRIDSVIDRLNACTPASSSTTSPDLPLSPPGTIEWNPAWGIPRVLVVNCQMPYKAGWLIGGHPEDDGGLSAINYFVLSKRASALLAQGQLLPSLRLWKRFCEEKVSSKEGYAFKVVGRVEDLDKYDVPESFHRFNNKPVLLTKSATVISHRLPEVIEIDYDVRTWVWPARSTLANYNYRAKEAELEIAYLVEGKTDDELPEQILGCVKLSSMDITAAHWVPGAA